MVTPDRETADKQFATLQAQAALKGVGLMRLPGGSILVTRWASSRECPTLGHAEALLRAMGVLP